MRSCACGQLTQLVCEGFSLHKDDLKSGFVALRSLCDLSLKRCGLNDECCEVIAHTLASQLTRLDLRDNNHATIDGFRVLGMHMSKVELLVPSNMGTARELSSLLADPFMFPMLRRVGMHPWVKIDQLQFEDVRPEIRVAHAYYHEVETIHPMR